MMIDSHAHIFSSEIIAAVSARTELVKKLSLDAERAAERTSPEALMSEAREAGVATSLLLPTSNKDAVRATNRTFVQVAIGRAGVRTLGTLHPHGSDTAAELEWFAEVGICGAKLCSFAQGFGLEEPETRDLLDLIRSWSSGRKRRFLLVFDTFYLADRYFGVPRQNLTTPARLGAIVRDYPEIDFVAAHMGGLTAPFDDVLAHLPPQENLFLETSNAAHTLAPDEFVELLRRHGSGKILFGTDWPWFGQLEEMKLIERLSTRAGFGEEEQRAVFGGNAARLLGIARD